MVQIDLEMQSIDIQVGFCGFTCGLGMVWADILFPKVKSGEVGITFSLAEETCIASFLHIGQIIATFPSGYVQDRIGRRNALLLFTHVQLCAWILIFLSRTLWAILLARILMGMWSGFTLTGCSVYVSEIASPTTRGSLSASLTLMFMLGFVFQTTVGTYISYDGVAVTSFSLTIGQFLALACIPESPYSLIRLGKVDQAEKNLKWLRGNKDVKDDFNYIKFNLNLQITRKTGYKEIFRWKASRKAFIQAFTIMLVQRFTGFIAFASFGSTILPQSWFIFTPDHYPMIWSVISVTFLFIAICITDYVDRKVLLMISSAGCAIFSTVLSVWFYLYEKTSVNISGTIWIPYIALATHTLFYSFGLFYIPIVFMGEIFPMNTKSQAISLISFASFIESIISVLIFLPMSNYIGMYSNFVLFSFFAFLGCCVTSVLIETRNKSLEYIQNKLEGVESETGGGGVRSP